MHIVRRGTTDLWIDGTRAGRAVASAVLGLAMASACAEVEVDGRSEAIQSDRNYFRVALDEPGPLGAALRATGTLFVPVLDASGVPVTRTVGSETVPIRTTCGVTFVSRRHAITAAHCVPHANVPSPATTWLEVQTYTIAPDAPWEDAKAISGSWPAFGHPQLVPENGYQTAPHACRVVMRCGGKWGPHNCSMPLADVALLECPDLPGCTAGTVDVAASESAGMPIEMPWSHEVYDIPPVADAPELETHYSAWAEGHPEENFHYFGAGRNQLLPLLSTPFATGPHTTTGLELVPDLSGALHQVRWTNLGGCHGTSGAGVVTQDSSTNEYRLLGPISVGMIPADLCIENFKVTPAASTTFAYSPRAFTAAAVEAGVTCTDICPGTPENVYFWNACSAAGAEEHTEAGLFESWPPPEYVQIPPYEEWRVVPEPTFRVDPDRTLTIRRGGYVAGESYRLSLRVLPAPGASAIVDASLGGHAIFTGVRPTFHAGERAGVITAVFRSRVSGLAALVLHADRTSGPLRVTEVVVQPERVVLAFDRHDQRAGVGLVSPLVAGGDLTAARFTGDGRGGLAPSLRGGERLVLTRLALAPGRTWSLAFATDADARLVCGVVLSDGTERTAPCDAVRGTASARLTPPAGLLPLAFFVDADRGAPAVRIDDVRIE